MRPHHHDPFNRCIAHADDTLRQIGAAEGRIPGADVRFESQTLTAIKISLVNRSLMMLRVILTVIFGCLPLAATCAVEPPIPNLDFVDIHEDAGLDETNLLSGLFDDDEFDEDFKQNPQPQIGAGENPSDFETFDEVELTIQGEPEFENDVSEKNEQTELELEFEIESEPSATNDNAQLIVTQPVTITKQKSKLPRLDNPNQPAWQDYRTKVTSLPVSIPVVELRKLAKASWPLEFEPYRSSDEPSTHNDQIAILPLHRHIHRPEFALRNPRKKRPWDAFLPQNRIESLVVDSTAPKNAATSLELSPEDMRKAVAPITAFIASMTSPRASDDSLKPRRSQSLVEPSRRQPIRRNSVRNVETATSVPKLVIQPTQPQTPKRNPQIVTASTSNAPGTTNPEQTPTSVEDMIHSRSTTADITPLESNDTTQIAITNPSKTLDSPTTPEGRSASPIVASPEDEAETVGIETLIAENTETAPPAPSQQASHSYLKLFKWLPLLVFLPIVIWLRRCRKRRLQEEFLRLRALSSKDALVFPCQTRTEERMKKLIEADAFKPIQLDANRDRAPVATAAPEPATIENAQATAPTSTMVAENTPPAPAVDSDAINADWLTLGESLVMEELNAAANAEKMDDEFETEQSVTASIPSIEKTTAPQASEDEFFVDEFPPNRNQNRCRQPRNPA